VSEKSKGSVLLLLSVPFKQPNENKQSNSMAEAEVEAARE
jgi:hypothetical protein